jgi:hypothetical protein
MLEGEGVKEYTTRFPAGWRRALRVNKVFNYQTTNRVSRIVINNPTRQTSLITLSFTPKLVIWPHLRYQFYREEIHFMDRQIGSLLEFLKKKNMLKDSAFLLYGDHGEGLGEYKSHYGHIHYLNKVYSRVPLILSGVGIPKRGKQSLIADNMDIAPTVLDILGLEKTKAMLGSSLLTGEKKHARVFLETYAPEAFDDCFSIIDYPYQFIFFPNEKRPKAKRLYNLETDPHGVEDIWQTETSSILKTRLFRQTQKILKTISRIKRQNFNLSKDTIKMLKSLGYL